MIASNKISRFVERIDDNFKRPIVADIFLTDFCNSSCSYCRYAERTGKYIEQGDFRRYLLRLRGMGVKAVILTGGGEPTIHPYFGEIVKLLEDYGIPYGINTNGIKFQQVVAQFVKISIDEGTAEEYTRSRGVDKFGEVLDNVANYCLERDRIGGKTRIGVQCVVRDAEQVKAFYSAVKRLSVDYIQYRPLELPRWIDHKDYDAALNAIYELKAHDERIYLSYKFQHLNWVPEDCYGRWTAICVKTNGDIPVCCHRPDEIIGNIDDTDIAEKFSSYRVADMGKCERPCRLTGANWYLQDYKQNAENYFI